LARKRVLFVAALVIVVAASVTGVILATRGGGLASATRCRLSQLKTEPVIFEGLLGGGGGGVGITNSSGSACSLPTGAPLVSLVLRGKTLDVRQIYVAHPFRMGGEPVVHRLGPGQSAQIDVQWRNWCGMPKLSNYPRDFPAVRVQFVGGPVVGLQMGPKPYCASPGSPSTLTATQPLHLHTLGPSVRRFPPTTGDRNTGWASVPE
jgi:hypothetical protein